MRSSVRQPGRCPETYGSPYSRASGNRCRSAAALSPGRGPRPAGGDDMQPPGCQRPLQGERLGRGGRKPGIAHLAGQDHRHGLGVHGLHHLVRLGGQKREQEVLAVLAFAPAAPSAPDAREGKQRAIGAKGKPVGDFGRGIGVFAERGCRYQATRFRSQPVAPERVRRVAHVGDRARGEAGRRREPPSHRHHAALACGVRAYNRSQLVRENTWQLGLVTCAVPERPGELHNCLTRTCHRIKIAHSLPASDAGFCCWREESGICLQIRNIDFRLLTG